MKEWGHVKRTKIERKPSYLDHLLIKSIIALGRKESLNLLVFIWGVVAEWITAPNSSSGSSVQHNSVAWNLVVTLVSLRKTLHNNCLSSPRGKWTPVRAEMVLVIGLAE